MKGNLSSTDEDARQAAMSRKIERKRFVQKSIWCHRGRIPKCPERMSFTPNMMTIINSVTITQPVTFHENNSGGYRIKSCLNYKTKLKFMSMASTNALGCNAGEGYSQAEPQAAGHDSKRGFSVCDIHKFRKKTRHYFSTGVWLSRLNIIP